MDATAGELVRLIDRAIAAAEERMAPRSPQDALTVDQLKLLADGLRSLREEVEGGRLRPSPKGGSLITPLRPVIDLGEPGDSPLRQALFEIEQFYGKRY